MYKLLLGPAAIVMLAAASSAGRPDAPEASFSACVLALDENARLIEWLAFHYQILPLRRLIVAIDPRSRLRPSSILQRWAGMMNITEWSDADYGFTPGNRKGADALIGRHRSRQTTFFRRCMLSLKAEHRTWVALVDADEFVAFDHLNTRAPSVGEATVLRSLGDATPCVTMPRSLYGAVESTPEEIRRHAPSGYDAMGFQTLRFRKHASDKRKVKSGTRPTPINGWGKNVVDVSRAASRGHENFQVFNIVTDALGRSRIEAEAIGQPKSVHRAVFKYCPCPNCYENQPPLRVHHYLGSRELHLSRVDNDARQYKKGEHYETRAVVSDVTTDHVRPWLAAFVANVGAERADKLLAGVGVVRAEDDRSGPWPPRPPADPARAADAAPSDAPALPNPLAADARALAPPEKTPMERLVELKTIFEAGLISEDEMQAKRAAILAMI